MPFLKSHFDTEGPFGIPMKDKQAKALETIIKQNDGDSTPYRRAIISKATTELAQGERADVSWISTESVDRDKEIVLSSGFRDDHFVGNPIVTLNHNYDLPPIGKSVWRKKIKEGEMRGVKAKTQYPAKPEDWPESEWAPDTVYSLIQSGLAVGKSIGFFTVKSHSPTPEEVHKNPELASVWRIIDEWMLLEYAVCWLPCNQDALVEAVGKGLISRKSSVLQKLGVEIPPEPTPPGQPKVTAFTPWEEVQKNINRRVAEIDFNMMVKNAIERNLGHV